MLIVWGDKKKEKALGWAADFCPMCRAPRAFRVCRVGLAPHVYYLSVGSGQLLGHVGVCQSCGHEREVDAGLYQGLEKRRPDDLAELERATFPKLREVWAERLALEERVAAGKAELGAEERAALVREPFDLVAPEFELRYQGSTHFDRYAALAALATFAMPALAGFVASGQPQGSTKAALGWAALVLFGAGALVTLFFLFTESRRYVRRKVLPKLAGALRPLEPTREELEHCVAQMRSLGVKLGKKLRVDELYARIEEPAAPDGLGGA